MAESPPRKAGNITLQTTVESTVESAFWSFADYVGNLRNPTDHVKTTIAEIRKIVESEGKASLPDKLKLSLPCVTIPGRYEEGRAGGKDAKGKTKEGDNRVGTLSGLQGIDLDNIISPENDAQTARKTLEKIAKGIPHCVLLFRSPTTGFWAVHWVPELCGQQAFSPDIEKLRLRAWHYLSDLWAEVKAPDEGTQTGVDEHTKDRNRATFLSHDEDLYCRPTKEKGWLMPEEGFTIPEQNHPNQARQSAEIDPDADEEDSITPTLNFEGDMIKGSRHLYNRTAHMAKVAGVPIVPIPKGYRDRDLFPLLKAFIWFGMPPFQVKKIAEHLIEEEFEDPKQFTRIIKRAEATREKPKGFMSRSKKIPADHTGPGRPATKGKFSKYRVARILGYEGWQLYFPNEQDINSAGIVILDNKRKTATPIEDGDSEDPKTRGKTAEILNILYKYAKGEFETNEAMDQAGSFSYSVLCSFLFPINPWLPPQGTLTIRLPKGVFSISPHPRSTPKKLRPPSIQKLGEGENLDWYTVVPAEKDTFRGEMAKTVELTNDGYQEAMETDFLEIKEKRRKRDEPPGEDWETGFGKTGVYQRGKIVPAHREAYYAVLGYILTRPHEHPFFGIFLYDEDATTKGVKDGRRGKGLTLCDVGQVIEVSTGAIDPKTRTINTETLGSTTRVFRIPDDPSGNVHGFMSAITEGLRVRKLYANAYVLNPRVAPTIVMDCNKVPGDLSDESIRDRWIFIGYTKMFKGTKAEEFFKWKMHTESEEDPGVAERMYFLIFCYAYYCEFGIEPPRLTTAPHKELDIQAGLMGVELKTYRAAWLRIITDEAEGKNVRGKEGCFWVSVPNLISAHHDAFLVPKKGQDKLLVKEKRLREIGHGKVSGASGGMIWLVLNELRFQKMIDTDLKIEHRFTTEEIGGKKRRLRGPDEYHVRFISEAGRKTQISVEYETSLEENPFPDKDIDEPTTGKSTPKRDDAAERLGAKGFQVDTGQAPPRGAAAPLPERPAKSAEDPRHEPKSSK